MADLNKTIQIVFGATDKTGSVISGVSNRLGSIAAPVANLTKKFLMLEAAIAAVGVAFAVKAFKESSSFEGALLDLQKVMSDADGDARQFTGTVDAMSNRFGIASTEILQGAANFKQAGFTVKEAFELQKIANETAVVSNLSVAESSELIVSALKGFKAPASEAGRLTDILNEVSNRYATSLKELGIGMSALSPIANLMGFSMEETAGILTPIIEVFRSGSEAAVALRTGLLNITGGSKKVTEALHEIGVSARDGFGKLRSGKDILNDVSKAFTTLDRNSKIYFAGQLVGKRQAGRMVEVFDGLAKSTEVTSVGFASAGSRLKEVEIRLKSSELQVDRAKVAFNNMARSIGDQFRPELTGVIKSITDIEIALQGIAAGGGFEPLFNLIRPQLEEWQEILGKIAQALPAAFEQMDFSPILDALKRIGGSFGSMFDGLDLTKPEDLAKVFNRIIDIGGSMIDVTAGIVEIFGEVGAILFKAVKWFSELDSETQKIIGSVGGISIALTTLLIPALAATGLAMTALNLKFVAMAGTRGIGALIASLTGAAGLATAAGVASASTTGLGAALGVARFNAVNTTSKISLLTKSLGKAGLVGAIALATYELGKFVKQRLGTEGLIQSLTGVSGLSMAVLKARNKAAKETLALPGENTSAEKAVLDAIRQQNAKAAKDPLGITGKQTDAVMEKYNKLVEDIGKRNTKSAKEILALPGENTRDEKKSLDAIRAKIKANEDLNKSLAKYPKGFQGAVSFSKDTLSISSQELHASSPAIEREATNRRKFQKEEKKILDQQVKLNREKLKRLRRSSKGDYIIKVTADGLEPELEAFIWPLLERIQLRANAEGAEYLLGIT